MKKFLAIIVLGLLLSSNAYADGLVVHYFCKIFKTEKCIEKKHRKEAGQYCFKIYPFTKEDLEDPLGEKTENYDKCVCKYMNQKGHEKDCRPLIDRIRDITNKK